jgi:tyrosine-protein phosphatase SIW14
MMDIPVCVLRSLCVVACTAFFFCTLESCVVAAQSGAVKSTYSTLDVAAIGASAQKLRLAGVQNAGQVSDRLYRGAQPSAKGFAELKKLGVTTIVNLREKGRETEWERNVAASLGLAFVNIPIRGWAPPSDAQVAEFLKLFRDASRQRVFVHCHYGEDRTGVMVGAYRIALENWTADQALSEMNSFGFHYHLYSAMKAYVRRLPARLASEAVFSSVRTASTEAKEP